MNVAIANKLVNLRKSFGMSQEDLAAKLNVSRQAVSKWERAESSPDTDNLIALAGIYGMTIDEILNPDIEIARAEADDKKEEKRLVLKQVAWAAIGSMLSVITFFVTGFLFHWWAFNWVFFLMIPIFWYVPIIFMNDR